jgi:hypothetical protein
MRKKAENAIRAAAARLGTPQPHRIDRVRKRTDLLRKVFDKTLLHMAQVGTIQLHGGPTDHLTDAQIRDLVPQGDRLHVSFSFLDAAPPQSPSPAPPAPRESVAVSVTLRDLDRDEWERFQANCRRREGKSPAEKLREMILAYNADPSSPGR